MARKRGSQVKTEWVSYTFRCHKTNDSDLIKFLESQAKNERSAAIRDGLRLGKRLPRPANTQPVDLETLRAELSKAVDMIIESLPVITFGNARGAQVEAPRAIKDVNKNGRNIPDF